MWLDLSALLLLAVFAGIGLARGAIASGFALLALVGAYAAAWWAGPALAPLVAERLELARVIALPLAGLLAFVATYAGVVLLGAAVRWLARRPAGARGRADRALGAAFGTLRGLAVVLALGWLALWLDGLRHVGRAPWAPEAEASLLGRATQEAIERGVAAALGGEGPAARAAARAAARPADTIRRFESLLEDPRIEALRNDALFWTHVEAGSVDAALVRLSFQQVSSDAGLRGELAELGLVPAAAAADPGTFRREVAVALREVTPRLRGLRHDPEVRRLVDDPEVQQLLASGDTLGLLRHPGFQHLIDRVVSGELAGDPPPGTPPQPGGDAVVRNYSF